MTTPEHQPPAPQPSAPASKDRIYRSPMGLVGGALLLAIILWLGIDALVVGKGRTPWLALATLLLVVPLVMAFTLRPAVFAGEDRLRIRNPFRVIVLPWGQVETFRSGYSNEVLAKSGTKFQLWAIPVSLRGRSRAARRQARAQAEREGKGGRSRGARGAWGAGTGGGLTGTHAVDDGPMRAETDKIMDDLGALLEARGKAVTAQGEVTVRWAYEVMGPAVAGAVLLGVLAGTA
ncbi:PH domain-containing protein [Streptomyces sp. HUCO-GS316]|uniref:PH domain-containing protein n=1 Tax=Streptomyces sp. HUCO-GS316 TaxID=2692198 RepID=UPI001368515D|nr:PH domain-containing protein [Streptomyces sp. HUCO-GS316]MXM67169.1 PH domain-containing protein [Streptomyces sp. HUCO-GS316]